MASNPYGWGEYVELGLAKEATYGEYVSATAGLRIKPTHFSALGPVMIETGHASGHLMDKSDEIARGINDWELSIEGAVPKNSAAFGYLLETIFDELTTDKYTIGNEDTVSLSIALIDNLDDGKAWTGVGAKLRDLKLSVSANDWLMFSGTLVGTDALRAETAPVLVYPDALAGESEYYTFDDCSEATYNLHSFEVNIASGIHDGESDSHEISSEYRVRLAIGKREITGTLDRVETETVLFDTLDGVTDFALDFAAAAGARTLEIMMAKSRIMKWTSTNVAELFHESVDYKAFWSSADPDADFFVKYTI